MKGLLADFQLRILLIAPDADLAQSFAAECGDHHRVTLCRTLTHVPSSEELSRILALYLPNCLAVATGDSQTAAAIIRTVRQSLPSLPVIALDRTCETETVLQTMRIGAQELVCPPAGFEALDGCFGRIRELARLMPAPPEPEGVLFAFLPAKPGSGASTIATHLASSLARIRPRKVLLTDFDLSGGIIRFLLRLNAELSVVDAAADLEDPGVWARATSTVGGLDVMHAGVFQPQVRVDPQYVALLTDQARRDYQTVVGDLSGGFEKYSVEVMRRAGRLFLVTTPELPALHLARQKALFLEELGLRPQLSLLVNRYVRKTAPPLDEIAALVGLPVFQTLPNEYASVQAAIAEGNPLRTNCDLGKELDSLATRLLGGPEPELRRTPRKFLEFFSVGQDR